MDLIKRVTLSIFLLFCFYIPSHSLELSELQSETAEDLLLFFEEEELVIATRTKKQVREAPAIAMVITEKEINHMGARDLTDILKMVPGFGVSINEHGVLMYEVRGIRTTLSEKILVMIDGHSLNRNYVGSALSYTFDRLPVENIRRIEIVKGPGSALYGANAFVAIINIVTKGRGEADNFEVKGSLGSFETRKINMHGGKTFDNGLEISGSFDYYETEGPDRRIEGDSLSINPLTEIFSETPGSADLGLEQTDIFLKILYGDLSFRAHYMTKERGPYIGLNYALTDDSVWKLDHFWSELSYELSLTDDLNSTIKIYFDQFEQDASIELIPEGFAGQFPDGMIGEPRLKDRTVGAEVQVNYNVFDNNAVTAGIMYEKLRQFDVTAHNNFDPRLFPPTPVDLGSVQDITSYANWNKNTTREIWAVYIQDEWEIMDDLNLTAGIRHDDYSDIGSSTNPRTGIVWGFMERAELKLLYGRAFRAPNFVELYNRNNPVIVGSDDLEPETIETYEAGLGIRFEEFSINGNYFYSRIDKMIDWDTSKSPAEYANIREADVEGFELMVTGKYSHDNYWKVSYLYQDPRDRDTDEKLPNVPSHRANVSINYGITRDLTIHTDLLWTGKRQRIEGDSRDDIPAYTTVDLSLQAKNIYKTLEIQGTIHNLFDENYSDPDTSGAQQLIPDDFPREGISGMVNVTYRF